jgi:hypothetical protein
MKNFKLDFVPPHESAFPNVRGSVRIFSLPKQMQTIPIGVALRATTSIAAHFDGLAKGRTSGLFDGSDPERGRRGSAARAPGTGGFEMSDGEQPSNDALRPDQVASISARTLDVPIIQCRMNAPQLSRTTRRGLESSAVAGSVGSASRLSIARMPFAAMSRRG